MSSSLFGTRLRGIGLGLGLLGLGALGTGALSSLGFHSPSQARSLQPPRLATSSGAIEPMLAQAGVKGGSFRAAEAPVRGAFTLEKRDNRQLLRLSDDFRTNDRAPDLKLTLGRSATPIAGSPAPAYPLKEGTYTVIAPLRASAGGQTYELPAGIDLSRYGSVIIWCEQFNATMAWAPLGR